MSDTAEIFAHASVIERNRCHVMQHIIACVCDAYGIEPAATYPHSRRHTPTLARMTAMKMALELHLSASKIGRVFRRDHSTVLAAEKAINRKLGTDPDYAAKYAAILGRVRNDLASLV